MSTLQYAAMTGVGKSAMYWGDIEMKPALPVAFTAASVMRFIRTPMKAETEKLMAILVRYSLNKPFMSFPP